jgi:hypothetical protein
MATDEQVQVVMNYLCISLACPECGTRVQFGDLECPHCGADFYDLLRQWSTRVVDDVRKLG